MSVREVAAAHARERARLAATARREAKQAWARVNRGDISASWALELPRLLMLLTHAQHGAASSADEYVGSVLGGRGATVNPAAFVGTASDGRELAALLALPAIVAKTALSHGHSLDRAMAAGGALAELSVHTQVADAGRTADQAALVARGAQGYVRMVVGETCSRCIILAGRWYRWDAGFSRHPKCDCIGIPAAESDGQDLTTDPGKIFESMTEVEQDRVFTAAGAQAIREGADMARVVNARRGMQKAADGRLYTTEAAGRRPRLMPEQIYLEAAGNRDEAQRLLRLHGYLLPGATPRTSRPIDPLAGVRLDRLPDGELFALWDQHADDPGSFDRIGAELDRRDRERADQLNEVDPELLPVEDGAETLAEFDEEQARAVDPKEAEKAALELEVDRLVDAGMSYAEAYAQAYAGVADDSSTDDMALAERLAAVDVERRSGESREQTVRRMYEESVYLQYMDAEHATRGHLLSREAEVRGVDPIDLFSGPAHVARANASEELKRWWAENGGRKTYTEFRAEILGRASDIRAAQQLAGPANDRDFGL